MNSYSFPDFTDYFYSVFRQRDRHETASEFLINGICRPDLCEIKNPATVVHNNPVTVVPAIFLI